jgi:hypothetical protein
MSDHDDHHSLIPPASGFTDAMTLLAIAADPKSAEKRLNAIRSEIAKFAEAKAEVEAAQAALASAKAEQEAELGKREQELNEYAERLREREYAVVRSRETVLDAVDHMRTLDKQMKRAVMSYAGILDSFNERLQDLPSWEALNRDMLGSDPHFDGDEPVRVAQETETEPVPNTPEGGTLMRSVPRSRTAARREALSRQ